MLLISRHFNRPESKPITPEVIEAACEKTAERLNDVLGTHDIHIALAGNDNDKVALNYDTQWGSSKFEWENGAFPQWVRPKTNLFTLGLFKGYTLCSLCESGVRAVATRKKSLDILFIENAPSHVSNPLKGLAIATFSQVNLEIAKKCGVELIGVDRPARKTVRSYKQLGYGRHFLYNLEFKIAVSSSSKLRWDRVIARRRNQGLIPTQFTAQPSKP